MYPQDSQHSIESVAEALKKGNSGLIVLPLNPSPDAIAAATSLYLGLTKMGKNVSLAASSPPQSDLFASDKIKTSLTTGGDNLVITFPFTDGAVDKVDYSVLGNTFNVIITPRENQPKLDPSKVQFSHSGGNVDFIVTVDAPNLNSLGPIYKENESVFRGKTLVNIDRHLVNDFFGTLNLVNKTSSSTSEIVANLLEVLGVQFDRDMATNLYSGLSSATNNFTSFSVNAITFETAAKLLKAGALKKPPMRSRMQPPAPRPFPMAPMTNGTIGPREQQRITPIEQIEMEPELDDDETGSTPQDWLKPKIFRGTGLV